jgi:hypothetical protein
MGIRDGPTSFRSPWQNGYAERLIGGRSIQSDIRTGAKKFSPAIAGGAPAQRPPTSELEIESTIFVSSGVLVMQEK